MIESKNHFGGNITGDTKSKYWTEYYGKESFKIPNPLWQNYGHCCTISEYLNIDKTKLKPMVIFAGCFTKFKKPIADNVLYISEAHKYIKSFVEPILTDSEVSRIIYQLKSVKRIPRKQHIENLQKVSVVDEPPKCPKCSSTMKKRFNRTTGEPFWGCPNYPPCRGMIRYSSNQECKRVP